jgi:hypothetical protein
MGTIVLKMKYQNDKVIDFHSGLKLQPSKESKVLAWNTIHNLPSAFPQSPDNKS